MQKTTSFSDLTAMHNEVFVQGVHQTPRSVHWYQTDGIEIWWLLQNVCSRVAVSVQCGGPVATRQMVARTLSETVALAAMR